MSSLQIWSIALAVFINPWQSIGQPVVFDSLKLILPGANLVHVTDQFKFTEGPAVDKKGNVFFTDQPNDKIWQYDTNAKLSIFMDKTGRSNGLFFDKKDKLYSCADENNEIWCFDKKGNHKVIFSDLGGKKLNGPNDLWITSTGGIYFTDPFYPRDYWQRTKSELDGQKVYFLAKGKKEPIIVDADLKQPNGIIGSSNGKYLYVADIRDSKTYRYEIQPDGKLANKKLFVDQGSDGMTTDSKGNIYLTGRGVTIYNPGGIKIGYIPVPSKWTANICFGGADRKTLFITASESVYILSMQVAGVK